MTNQDAVYIIKWNLLDRGGCDSFTSDEREALNKAIESLETTRKVGKWIPCDWKHLEHGFMESDTDAGLCCSSCRTAFKKDKMTFTSYCPACGSDNRTPTEVQLDEADDVMMG